MIHHRPSVSLYYVVALVFTAIVGCDLLFPGESFAKPPIADVPGRVVRMDASPIAHERRALRDLLTVEHVALAELRVQLAAATDDDARGDLAMAIEARKNTTRLQMLEIRIEYARARGEQVAAAKLESRRAKLVRQVGERMPTAPASEKEVAR